MKRTIAHYDIEAFGPTPSTSRPYGFEDWFDMMLDSIPVDPQQRATDARLQERLRTATPDEARQLARDIIRGRHNDNG